ncbi:hypothetical protein [Streptomyces rimosus]|uniref:hypothetical protein n=1 Tax=Streptomyces rimosus TaxID=1927 RepID=UPI0004C14F7A|nr:hypothetical protein [Streptomyces rimosus]
MTTLDKVTPPAAEAMLTALRNTSLAAHYDQRDEAVLAYLPDTDPDSLTSTQHAMIASQAFDAQWPFEWAGFEAHAWAPGGPYGLQEVKRLHDTAHDRRETAAEEATLCAKAVAEWLDGCTAGSDMLAALAEYGIVPGAGLSIIYGPHSDTYEIPVHLGRGVYGHLSIADQNGSVRHLRGRHTGWSMLLHDEHGEPIGDPVYGGDGGDDLVDCAEDSAACAALAADWVTSPVSRHCDCYAQERHNQQHDRECNRYRRPA